MSHFFSGCITLFFGACYRFTLKQKGGSDEDSIEITVYDYFVNHRHIDLRYSSDLPCINVGKPKRPTFIPIEVELFFPLKFKITMLVIDFLPIECFLLPHTAMLFGLTATIHKSTVYISKGLTRREIEAKATRKDEGFV